MSVSSRSARAIVRSEGAHAAVMFGWTMYRGPRKNGRSGTAARSSERASRRRFLMIRSLHLPTPFCSTAHCGRFRAERATLRQRSD